MLNIDDRLIKEVSPQIGPNALSVLLAIAIHLNKRTGRAFPSHARLMELTGMSKNTVYDALKRLKQFGLLVSEQRIDSEKGHFGKRTFRLTTRFISIFIAAEDAEPLPEQEQDTDRFPKNRLPVSRLPENRLPENWETQRLNKEEQINKENELENGTGERARENEPETFDLEAEKNTPTPIPPAPSPAAPSWRDRPRTDTPAQMSDDLRRFYTAYPEDWKKMLAESGAKYPAAELRGIITAFCAYQIENNRTANNYQQTHAALQRWLISEKNMRKTPANSQRAAAAATYEPPRRILN